MTIIPSRPPFWRRMSVLQGNFVQLIGVFIGLTLLYAASVLRDRAVLSTALMLGGWLAIYICTHASAHWLVGRLVGIQFDGYGLRGSDHAHDYPPIPGLRAAMRRLPTFTAISNKVSMQAAAPVHKALMFGAGETSTTVFCLLTSYYAWRREIPGGDVFFVVMIIFSVVTTIVTSFTPRGDYAKAAHALTGPRR